MIVGGSPPTDLGFSLMGIRVFPPRLPVSSVTLTCTHPSRRREIVPIARADFVSVGECGILFSSDLFWFLMIPVLMCERAEVARSRCQQHRVQGEWIDRKAGALSQRGLGQEIKAATDTPQPGTHPSLGQCCVGPSFSLCPMASNLYSPHHSPAYSAQSPVSSSIITAPSPSQVKPPETCSDE